jgi:hypothetical protein
MNRKFAGIAAVCALLTVTTPARAASYETPHLEFVKLYIEQLGAIEDIRDAAAKELQTDPDTEKIADCVHTMMQYQLELSTQIVAMQDVHLNKPFDSLAENIVDFEKQKLSLYKQYGGACTTMMEGPKPNIDYGKIAAAPRAQTGAVHEVGGNICQAAARYEHQDGVTGAYGCAGVTPNHCYRRIPNAFDSLWLWRGLRKRRGLRD